MSHINPEKSIGEQKVQEYIDRIKKGESKDSVLVGLSPTFIRAIEEGLENSNLKELDYSQDDIKIPPQYEGLNSEMLDFIWTIPEYLDPEKTKLEKEKKSKILEKLKSKEEKEKKEKEQEFSDLEDAENIKIKLDVSEMKPLNSFSGKDKFSEFRMKNGETDQGFFWNEYRNVIAKELKNSGQFEWGKERIYFDVSIQDCEKLRDIVLKISSEEKIPVAFKYIDDKKTFSVHKDGSETRFVINFASSDDARRFYSFLSKDSEYKNLQQDRHLNYNGIRIDTIAEYASGFREGRAALERIMNAELNKDGFYEYVSEGGKKITLNEAEFNNFKRLAKELEESIEKEKSLWDKAKAL